MVQEDGSATPVQYCSLGQAERMLPLTAGLGQERSSSSAGSESGSSPSNEKLILAMKLEVRRAGQTSQAGFHRNSRTSCLILSALP